MESLDNQDPPDPRERLETPVSLELKVSVERTAHKVSLDPPERMVPMVSTELTELLV